MPPPAPGPGGGRPGAGPGGPGGAGARAARLHRHVEAPDSRAAAGGRGAPPQGPSRLRGKRVGWAWPGSPQLLAHERKEGAGLTPSPPAPVDAQHYIEHIESLAQQRKNQVIRLTEENKAFGRKLKQAPQRPKLGEEFGADGTDLPPRTRAMFEDNRMMKDRVKKYKDKVAQNERTITLQQQQVLKLQDKWTQPREVGLPRAPGKGSFS